MKTQTLRGKNSGVIFGFPLALSIWLTGDSGWLRRQTKHDVIIALNLGSTLLKPMTELNYSLDQASIYLAVARYLDDVSAMTHLELRLGWKASPKLLCSAGALKCKTHLGCRRRLQSNCQMWFESHNCCIWRLCIGNQQLAAVVCMWVCVCLCKHCIERSGVCNALTLNILSLSSRPCSIFCWLEVSFSTRFCHCCSFSWHTHTQGT